jgi:transcriptional regulator with XRE-family HTH domain
MLPPRDSKDLPEALRKARIAKGLKLKDVADAIGIDRAMPGRYEDPKHSYHSRPSYDTWQKLNDLFYGNEKATTEGSLSAFSKRAPLEDTTPLCDATFEQLISELERRGATNIQHGWKGRTS